MNVSNVSHPEFGWTTADGLYNNFEGLLTIFYLVKPSRTFIKNVEDTPNFLQINLPTLSIFVLESILMWIQGLQNYKWQDSLVAVGSYFFALMPLLILQKLEFTFYLYLYDNYHVFEMPYNTMLTYVLCFLAADVSSYWAHRFNHEISFLWMFHEPHHTSEYFNLFAGLRISVFNRYVVALFDLPWAICFPPGVFMAHHQLNYAYMFWLHTETLSSFGPLEYIFISPRLHSVHHGRNRYCIDKNYGSVLSIWDQMFGTFQRPLPNEKIYYGLVHTLKSWDIPYNQFHYMRELKHRVAEQEGVGNKLSVMVNGPGWEPGKPRLGLIEDIPEIPADKECYDKKSATWVYVYATLHMVASIVMYKVANDARMDLSMTSKLVILAYLLWITVDVGYLLEHKWYSPTLELVRCALFFIIEWLITGVTGPLATLTAFRYLHLLSALVMTFKLKMYSIETDKDTKVE